jgi:hypothetical protein
MFNNCLPLGVARPGSEADHSSPSRVEVKNMWRIPPFPHWPSQCAQEQLCFQLEINILT